MKVIKNKNVALRDIHSTYFLINSTEKYWENNSIVRVNEVGKIIWDTIEDTDIEKIADNIDKIFEVHDNEMVKQDICYFLENLYKLGYIKYE